MKENKIEYKQDFDELHIIFNDKVDNPKVQVLDNGVMVEFDRNDSISTIVFPNFSKMLGRPINYNESFSLSNASFEDDEIVITLEWLGPPINIKLSI